MYNVLLEDIYQIPLRKGWGGGLVFFCARYFFRMKLFMLGFRLTENFRSPNARD